MAMPKENFPATPPNTEPHPMRKEDDLAEDLDLDEDAPPEDTEDEESDSGLGPRG
jgi:hypothetical protein